MAKQRIYYRPKQCGTRFRIDGPDGLVPDLVFDTRSEASEACDSLNEQENERDK